METPDLKIPGDILSTSFIGNPISCQEEQILFNDLGPLYDQRFPTNEIIKNGPCFLYLNQQHPDFIDEIEQYEPIYTQKEKINEECLKRENERAEKQNLVYNRVVYDCMDPSPFQDVKNTTDSYYYPKNLEDSTLVFESRFESGNLRRAIQIFDFEYDLVLRWDYNTKGNMQ